MYPTKNTTQKTKKMSNMYPTKTTTQNTKKMNNMYPTKNTTQKTKKMSNMYPTKNREDMQFLSLIRHLPCDEQHVPYQNHNTEN
jgi:hypothetical protein